MADISDTLAALSEAATQGEWRHVTRARNNGFELSGKLVADDAGDLLFGNQLSGPNGVSIAQAKANGELAVTLVNLFRAGQLVPVPSVEAVARVVADYQMSVGLPPDDAWEDADGIATAVIAAMKEGRE